MTSDLVKVFLSVCILCPGVVTNISTPIMNSIGKVDKLKRYLNLYEKHVVNSPPPARQ